MLLVKTYYTCCYGTRIRTSLLFYNPILLVSEQFDNDASQPLPFYHILNQTECNLRCRLWCIRFQLNRPHRQMMCKWMHSQSLYLCCCSAASSWEILDWSSGTDWACSWISRTLSSPNLSASLASSARLLMMIIQNHQIDIIWFKHDPVYFRKPPTWW